MSAPPIGRVISTPKTRAQAKKIQIQGGRGQQQDADAQDPDATITPATHERWPA